MATALLSRPGASLAREEWVAQARGVSIVAPLERLGVRLKRSGVELVGPCPVCGGRDRFSVNLRKQVFHCRGAGQGGDVIALTAYLEGCDFTVACEILTGSKPPGRADGETAEEREARQEAQAARAAAREKAEVGRAREVERFRERERRTCHAMWAQAGAVTGSPVETYLARRGLVAPPGARLRCASAHPLFASGAHNAALVHTGPAMLAAITGADERFAGLHATWIDLDAPSGKAQVPDPDTGEFVPAKKVRGSQGRGRIELVRVPEPAGLVLGEGIETVLSVWRALLEAGWPPIARTAFWSAINLGNLGGHARETVPHPTLRRADTRGRERVVRVPGPVPDTARPGLPIPESVTEIWLLGDGDSDRFTTEMTLIRASRRYARPGRIIRAVWAPEGEDFNDVLQRALR